MPATAVEVQGEEGAKGADDRHQWLVRDATDKADAQAAVEAASPATMGGLIRQPVHVREIDGWPGAWEATVTYGPGDFTPPEAGDSTLSFDTSNGTGHTDASLLGEPVAAYAPPGGTVPLTNGLIGITKDGVAGVDKGYPAFDFTVTKYVAIGMGTGTYIGQLRDLTWCTNDDEVVLDVNGIEMTFAAGSLLFKGASGSTRGIGGDLEISLKFSESKNATGLVVGDITGINKKGWEYLWIMYEETPDDTAGLITKRPIAVYVEKIYEEGDFAGLEPS